jgi:outer membrane protein OmpA-like peptidoglycan-associated protein
MSATFASCAILLSTSTGARAQGASTCAPTDPAAPTTFAEFVLFGHAERAVPATEHARVLQIGFEILVDPTVRRVIVQGHTDRVGSSSYNRALSDARASAVKALLVFNRVPAAMVETVAAGEAQPRARGLGAASRQTNRRVEIIIEHWTAASDLEGRHAQVEAPLPTCLAANP